MFPNAASVIPTIAATARITKRITAVRNIGKTALLNARLAKPAFPTAVRDIRWTAARQLLSVKAAPKAAGIIPGVIRFPAAASVFPKVTAPVRPVRRQGRH